MPLTFYHSRFCPRCARAKKHLQELLGSPLPETVVLVDVLKQPVKTWQDGIRMIPALKGGEEILSGITLSREKIALFLNRHDSTKP